MSSEQRSGIVVALPLWKVLTLDPAYLRHEIERSARELGLHQTTVPASSFGPIMATLRIELTQSWELDA